MVMKNLPFSEIFSLAEQVSVQKGQVVSKTVAQNGGLSITIFAFDKDEEISTHSARGDAFVTVLEGKGKFTIDGVPHILEKGQSIIMPVNIPHSVYGVEQFKMLLVVVYPVETVQENLNKLIKIE